MSHIKRQETPKNWPIPRKGSKFIIKGDAKGIPLLVILRDILKIAKNRKEVKKAIHEKNILICNKTAKDEKKSLKLLDTLTLIPLNKSYILTFSESGKFALEEINEKQSKEKISKIINKKILKGKRTQLNLLDGRNFFSDIKCSVNDSVLIDLQKNKIEKCLPLKENSKVLIIGGKHAGERGLLKTINAQLRMAEIQIKEKILNILIKQLMIIE